jgi:hypothetical protein
MSKGLKLYTADGGFVKVLPETEYQAGVIVGTVGGDNKDAKTHCHLWVDKKKGLSGVVHRGDCDQCRNGDLE